ncbi:NAD-dependent DNA ligase LigA [Pseudoclavibacter sp. VKM Ac-2867]|uniref:NAD-dependent DNA ligase LigA n=1 Tax=Pseudoclavibacter sp. VKM Ac-2867 TaxID=2783829 RepID=UPI00188C2274|nr:NAD-dependent DNA ligase LigA [Pseudoclavibacter sp. VKM Ac-2867]MBF4459491.1 NAD-dependent DNA ligase LigA [Pseudoclavibacter sp. VKM Ac-2867]
MTSTTTATTSISPADQYRADIETATNAAAAYAAGEEELITDDAYDALLERIAAFETAHPDQISEHGLFTAVSDGASSGGDIKHSSPMLSLEKATGFAELGAFLEQVVAAGGTGDLVTLEPKLDGIAVAVRYEHGRRVQIITRGDGVIGEDLSAQFSSERLSIAGMPADINADVTFEVRGEIVMSTEQFQRSNANRVAAGKPAFANPRNATAGSVRAATRDYDVELTFVAHSVPEGAPLLTFTSASDFLTVGTMVEQDRARFHFGIESLRTAIDAFGEYRKSDDYPFPTDGVVINAIGSEVRARLGTGSRAPKWAKAYKYTAERGVTTLESIAMAVGRTGNISFTANLTPTLVDGSVVSRATLHNFDFIQDNDLRIGDTVEVYKAGDIIPRVVKSFPELRQGEVAPYEPDRVCPISGEPLDTSGKIWRSTSPEASVGSLIQYAASRDVLDIDGLGQEVATALVEARYVSDLADLFALNRADLRELPIGNGRLGELRAAGIAEQIDQAKSQPLARVITALGIRKSGRTFGRRLAAHFRNFDALLTAAPEDFLAIEGVGDERARLFHEGFQARAAVIARLGELGVTTKVEETVDDAEAWANAKPLDGMKVVVTGAMTGPLDGLNRTEMNELIEAAGGASSSSVSKATSLLVRGEDGSSKFTKATALGIRIVTPEEFAEMVGRS